MKAVVGKMREVAMERGWLTLREAQELAACDPMTRRGWSVGEIEQCKNVSFGCVCLQLKVHPERHQCHYCDSHWPRRTNPSDG